jgi:hypothetical protein
MSNNTGKIEAAPKALSITEWLKRRGEALKPKGKKATATRYNRAR